MDFTIPAPQTEVTDHYHGLDITVPRIEGRNMTGRQEPGYEVTYANVTLSVATAESISDDEREEGVQPGDVFASVTLKGHPLTKAGKRFANGGVNTTYGHRDEETRWDLQRTLLLMSCARHDIDPTKIIDYPIATWDEYRTAEQARLMQQFGA